MKGICVQYQGNILFNVLAALIFPTLRTRAIGLGFGKVLRYICRNCGQRHLIGTAASTTEGILRIQRYTFSHCYGKASKNACRYIPITLGAFCTLHSKKPKKKAAVNRFSIKKINSVVLSLFFVGASPQQRSAVTARLASLCSCI